MDEIDIYSETIQSIWLVSFLVSSLLEEQTKLGSAGNAPVDCLILVCSSRWDETKKETNQINYIVSEYFSIPSIHKFLIEADYNK